MGTAWEETEFVNTWGRVLLLGALAFGAYQDGREKEIHIMLPVLAGVVGVILFAVRPQFTVRELAGGVGIGFAMLLITWISQGQIGAGDGMMVAVCGIFLGFWKNLELFFTALLLVALAALCLIIIKKRRRDYRVPFLPFVLAAYLLQLIGGA